MTVRACSHKGLPRNFAELYYPRKFPLTMNQLSSAFAHVRTCTIIIICFYLFTYFPFEQRRTGRGPSEVTGYFGHSSNACDFYVPKAVFTLRTQALREAHFTQPLAASQFMFRVQWPRCSHFFFPLFLNLSASCLVRVWWGPIVKRGLVIAYPTLTKRMPHRYQVYVFPA